MRVDWHHLAAEDASEDAITTRHLVHRDEMHQLVVHDGAHPLARQDRLEGETERRDLDP